MSSFARSGQDPASDAALPTLLWLAGLLEGEGSFMKPHPSAPGLPTVVCAMTDRDVVARVAGLFGTSVRTKRKPKYRTEFVARIRGSRAAVLMGDLRPFMSTRRQAAIERALGEHTPRQTKLNFEAARQICQRHAAGDSIASLARSYSVTRPTIRAVVQRRIYQVEPQLHWRNPDPSLGETTRPPDSLSSEEFCWLAGWLEAEGSFCAPPPSDPRRPRISAQTRDHDVAVEAGRLLGVTPVRDHPSRARNHGWSPMWRLLKRGDGAVELMEQFLPIMGARRSIQIQTALGVPARAISA